MASPHHKKDALKSVFPEKVKLWSNHAVAGDFPNVEEQARLLSEISDLITPDLPIEEVIAVIYASINQLMDAYQFAVGIYDDEEGTILFKGMIENNKELPDFVIDAFQENRFSPWCIRHEAEIFINDMDAEYSQYVDSVPNPMVGSPIQAALYVPLRIKDKIAGLITVRTPHKHVYHKHHLYILKTLGNFVMKSLELAHERGRPSVQSQVGQKSWRWRPEDQLSPKAKRILSLLTDREKEVLLLMVSGLPNKAIAEKLFVSPGTIKTHTLNIYNKMEVSNRTSAMVMSIELGWLQ